MNIKKTLLINKIIDRKNQDISWKQATDFSVTEESNENKEVLAEEAKTTYLKRLEEEQYIHSLS